jgi:chromosome segregation protein
MTKLVKLTLKNFKSFKKAEIPLSNGFTAIVGSNGSGKSNVLDALLFVLGITSLKTLRAGKLTDLVYNNAKENYAKVDLTIKNGGKNYEVSRMIDKQGKSIYRLDGKRTTLNEVNSLLVEFGIDITGHNIVTQGDITKVVNMSPMERRQIIDSIAGLSEFDKKKEEAVKELNKVDSRIKEATIILNERNTFLEELEKEMNVAQEFSGLSKEKKDIKATIISKELYQIEKRTIEVDKELKELQIERSEIQKNIEELNKEVSKEKQNANTISSKAIKGSEEIYNTFGKEFEEKKSKLNIEKDRIEIKQASIERNKKRIEDNNINASKSKQEINEIAEKIKELNKEKNDLDERLEVVTAKKEDLDKIAQKKNKEIIGIETELDEKNKEIDLIRKENFDLEVFIKQWEKQKSFNTKKLIELEEEEKELNARLSDIDSKDNEITSFGGLAKLEKELEKQEEELEKNNALLSSCNAFINQEKKAIAELTKEISKCPICESNLEAAKKDAILSEKKTTLDAKNKEVAGYKEKEAMIKTELGKVKDNLRLVARLTVEVEGKEAIANRIEITRDKIKSIKLDLDEKQFEAQINKKNNLDVKVRALVEKRELLKEKLNSLRKENIFEELTITTTKRDGLIHNKSLVDDQLNENRIGLSKMKSKEDAMLKENTALDEEINTYLREIEEKRPILAQIEEELSTQEKELADAKKENSKLLEEKEKLDISVEKMEKEIYAESGKAKKIDSRVNEFNIEKSKLEVREADLTEEQKEFDGAEKIGERTVEELKERLVIVGKRLEEIGAVNLKAMDNFTELKKEVDEIQEKASKLEEERLAVLDMIDKIDVKRTNVFMDCFNEINHNFKDMFAKFFNGEALLDLTNPDSPLESGLLIDAKPKGGKLQNIDSMSGGEKTLTALAFMFAIQLYSPAPFYAFDEADAALDKENSMKMGSLIEKIAEKSQFIAITHNDTITKKARQIVGVALNKDNSSVIGLKLKGFKIAS